MLVSSGGTAVGSSLQCNAASASSIAHVQSLARAYTNFLKLSVKPEKVSGKEGSSVHPALSRTMDVNALLMCQ